MTPRPLSRPQVEMLRRAARQPWGLDSVLLVRPARASAWYRTARALSKRKLVVLTGHFLKVLPEGRDAAARSKIR